MTVTSIEYEGKDYELNMTRAGVRAAEAAGLKTSEISEKPFTAAVGLLFASLYSRYKINPNKAAAIFDHIIDSGQVAFEDLFETLAEAYAGLFGSGGSES